MVSDELIKRVMSEFSNYDSRLLLLTAEGLKLGSEIRFSKTREELEKHLDMMDALDLNYHNFLRRHVHDDEFSHQLFFWKDWPRVNPEKAYEAYRNGGHVLAGKFFGYPKCCTKHAKGSTVYVNHINEMKEAYAKDGIEGIKHLAGIFHAPCSIYCEATKNLGFAEFLKERAPELYEDDLRKLINMAARDF